jgi:hypothetical protein
MVKWEVVDCMGSTFVIMNNIRLTADKSVGNKNPLDKIHGTEIARHVWNDQLTLCLYVIRVQKSSKCKTNSMFYNSLFSWLSKIFQPFIRGVFSSLKQSFRKFAKFLKIQWTWEEKKNKTKIRVIVVYCFVEICVCVLLQKITRFSLRLS